MLSLIVLHYYLLDWNPVLQYGIQCTSSFHVPLDQSRHKWHLKIAVGQEIQMLDMIMPELLFFSFALELRGRCS